MLRPEPSADLQPENAPELTVLEVGAVRACRGCKGLMEPVADPAAPWLKGGWRCPVCAPQITETGRYAAGLMGKSIGARKSGRRWRPASKSILR